MTAEIAILNRSAVALAADSAMTFGKPGSEKIYPVNKLFTLSKYHPVGIMIFNNAYFMGMPIETIIKMYREKVGMESEKTITDYATRFCEYLENPIFCTDKQQEEHLYNTFVSIFSSIKDEARTRFRGIYSREGKVRVSDYKKCLYDVIDEELVSFGGASDYHFHDPVDGRNFLRKNNNIFKAAVEHVFEGDKISQVKVRTLKRIAELSITKYKYSGNGSGLVIAGFGEDEIFPTIVEIEIDGFIANELRVVLKDGTDIGRQSTQAVILPFAQDEMVHRFMQGIDNTYHGYLDHYIRQWLRDFGKEVVNACVSDSSDKKIINKGLSNSIDDAMTMLHEDAKKFRKEQFIDPILDVVDGLPKEELAHMAEALVNLTSIKRRVSTEKETVGGPVDVAVISKGDGFVWIKRKHYFSPELNPRFNASYFNRAIRQEASNDE